MQVEDVTEMIGRKVSIPVSQREGGGNILFRMIVLVFTILIAALIVSFIMRADLLPQIPFLNGFFAQSSSTTATTTTPREYVPSASTVNFDPYADIEALRFFRIDPDATLFLTLSWGAAERTEDLLTFSQKVTEKLKEVSGSAKFIELQLTKDGGKPADTLTFASLSGINLFPAQFMTENFTPHIAAFIHRNPKGSWPGYIFKLLPNKNSRLLAPQIQLLERSPQVAATLFLVSPGTPIGGFVGSTRGGLPAREQTYTTPGAVISYAWQDRYFIISTSFEGLEEALRRLQG